MRVLVVHPGPRYSVSDVHNGLVKGLRQAGAQVIESKFADWVDFASVACVDINGKIEPAFGPQEAVMAVAGEFLQAEIYRTWPDVVVLVSAFWVAPEIHGILMKRPHKVVLWATEAPYEDNKQINRAMYVDAAFINDPTNLATYREVNRHTYYAPQSFDPEMHCPGPGKAEWACDVAWVGTTFQERLDWFRAVDWSGIDLKLGGFWGGGEDFHHLLVHPHDECLDNADTVTLYRSAKASFNVYRRTATWEGGDKGWSMGPREVELAATGTFFLRDPRPEGDEVLSMLPTFSSPEEFADKVRWWLRHDDARQEAAAAARAAVADRTFVNQAKRLLAVCESINKAA